MGKSKKEWGVHNQIGKHVGHFYQEMEGLRISSMHGIYSMVLGQRVGNLTRDGYDDHLRDTADVTCDERSQTKWYERTRTRLHHL